MRLSSAPLLSLSVLSLLSFTQKCDALLPLHVNGSNFIVPKSQSNDPKTNEVFMIKGIDYQIGGSSGYNPDSKSDALTDVDVCLRDAFVFQQLGINTIRIYTLNPDLDHDKCFTVLNNAGIYVILDVNGPNYGENLDRSNPWGTYNSVYLSRVFKFVENFKNYPNVIGFFSGNEVINDQDNYATIDPPYIRAVQRDIRQYLAEHPPANRSSIIPVGYSAADNDDIRVPTYEYLQCNSLDGTSINKDLEESSIDFYGINSYSWSNSATWTTSGYNILNSTFGSVLGRPVFFSEFGSIAQTPRSFNQISQALYNESGLANTLSGGLVYEYSQEANGYGLVSINSDDNSVTYKEDFVNLQKQYAKLNNPAVYEAKLNNPETKTEIIYCNGTKITSEFSSFGVQNFSIPSQPDEIASLIKNGVSAAHTGAILSDWTPPSSLSYSVYGTDSSAIAATITYPSANLMNAVYFTNTNTSSSTSTSTSATSSTSSKVTPSSSTSSSSSKKSKNNANHTGAFGYGFVSVAISVLLGLL